MNTSAETVTQRLSLGRYFVRFFAAFVFLFSGVAAIHYFLNYGAERRSWETRETLNVELGRRTILTDLDSVLGDLGFLARSVEQTSPEGQVQGIARPAVARLFQTFAAEKHLYDQIRLLDREGLEVVRVNYRAGAPRVVAVDSLQDKSGRYYFAATRDLGPGQVYISPLDLNIEDGVIEVPFKPMLRFARPVFDAAGGRQGLLLLNYYGERLISNFNRASANIADHVHLLDARGYWLSSPHREDEWGFMFGNERTFANRYPAAWQRINAERSGQFLDADGLFTFGSVDLLPERDPGYRWKIVSHLPLESLSISPIAFLRQNLSVYGSVLALLALGSLLLAQARYHHHWAETQREYERRFRQTLENIELAAVSVEQNGQATFCNKHFLRITGWREEEVVGSDWVEHFLPEADKAKVRAILGGLGQLNDLPSRYEMKVLARNGDERLIAWHNTLSYSADGKVVGITAIGEDITERRHAEDQVRKLSRAMEQSPSIVVITDRQGRIEYINPKFTEVSGYTLDEVKGLNPRFLKSGVTSAGEYRELWHTIAGGGEWRGEFHNRRKNGELYWESASISAVYNGRGEITNFLAVKEDITERKRLEATVAERNRELARTQTLAEMGRMASMIAHDLRNPLSSVKMALKIFAKRPPNGEAAELCAIGLDQVRYMENILADMLTYTRPEAMRLEWITVDKLLETSVAMLQGRLDELGVQVVSRFQSGLPTLPGDGNKLRQVFSNLIINAAQATEANPTGARQIYVSTMLHLGAEGTAVRVEICDNGSGIENQSAEKLFEPFYTTRTKGTGLGLAIVRQIAQQHEGSIELLRREPKGTCARLLLPTVRHGELDRSAAIVV